MLYQIQSETNIIDASSVQDWITCFQNSIQPIRKKLGSYYDGHNAIVKQHTSKNRPNYSVNINLAKYITDVATGYVFGEDIKYTADTENAMQVLEKIDYINQSTKASDVDFNVGGDMSCYGIGYQMIMVEQGDESIEDRVILTRLNPEYTFFVTDNTILQKPICAIYYYSYVEQKQKKIRVYVYDKENEYIFTGPLSSLRLEEEIKPHLMGDIPIIQSLNNDDAFGDYQQVCDILDALNLTMSNTTDDIQSIANAFLAIYGALLNGENKDEINEERIMNVPVGGKVEWVVKNLNPEASNSHIDNLLKFLFQISQVPDLTDDNFGGTQSGVAMRFKLWGLDQLWATKVKKYRTAIYKRLKILLYLLQYRFKTAVQLEKEIKISFFKNLPEDMSEQYEMVKALKGTVSEKTLLTNITVVDDVDAEMEQIKQEREEEADMYAFNNNKELNEETEKDKAL
jgi:SPP1 family phage portal protein